MKIPPSLRRRAYTLPRRPVSPCTLHFFLIALCVSTLTTPMQALVYTATPTAAQLPAAYAVTSPNTPLNGLLDACKSQAPDLTDHMLLTVRGDLTNILKDASKGGLLYLGGYYDAVSDTWRWWHGTAVSYVFANGPTGELLPTQLGSWAEGYPQLDAEGSVGARRYVAFDGSLMGWTNVAATDPLNGVACEAHENIVEINDTRFPWWAIFIIVILSISGLSTVSFCLCLCCRHKQKQLLYDGENNDLSYRSPQAQSYHNNLAPSAAPILSSREMSSSSSSVFSSSSCSYTSSSGSSISIKSFTSSNAGTRRMRLR